MERSALECTKMSVTFSVLTGHTVEGIVVPKLCHGDTIVHVRYGDDDVDSCDALVTEKKTLALGITTADCAPICFADGQRIGIAHIGWRGLCLGLIEKMCTEFDGRDVEVFVGPCLDTFEIQRDFCYEEITKKFGEQFLTTETGRIMFHFKDALTSLLPLNAIFDVRDTGTDMLLPSHRRDETQKRLLTMVQFKD